jgi:hypothetical protein
MSLVFPAGEHRIRKNNALANFTTVKHAASTLLHAAPGTDTLRVKRHLATWDEDFLAGLVTRR